MSKKHVDKSRSLAEEISQKIFFVRDEKVMLDSDLARVYGVKTKALVQAIKRNKDRFPSDFVFQLTASEYNCLKSQIAISKEVGMRSQFVTASKRNIRYLPYAFTEHGALMAANVLNSKRAVAMSVYVIRAFVRLRTVFLDNQILQERLREIEGVLLEHDVQLEDVYEKIKQLFLLSKKTKAIDFHHGNGNT